jgi:hypothetical protein
MLRIKRLSANTPWLLSLSVTLAICCFSPVGRAQTPTPDAEKVVHPLTRLSVQVIARPAYDGRPGKTSFSLVAKETDVVVKNFELPGLWTCLGYNEKMRFHVCVGQFQIGAILPGRAILYLHDDPVRERYSVHSQNSDLMILAAVASPEAHYVAMVSDLGKGFRLHVLDTALDRMKHIGKAPAPPPDRIDFYSNRDERLPWDWIDPVDGMEPMEPAIMSFIDEQTLQVTYGKDGRIRRARKRTVETWAMEKVFERPRVKAAAKKTKTKTKTKTKSR